MSTTTENNIPTTINHTSLQPTNSKLIFNLISIIKAFYHQGKILEIILTKIFTLANISFKDKTTTNNLGYDFFINNNPTEFKNSSRNRRAKFKLSKNFLDHNFKFLILFYNTSEQIFMKIVPKCDILIQKRGSKRKKKTNETKIKKTIFREMIERGYEYDPYLNTIKEEFSEITTIFNIFELFHNFNIINKKQLNEIKKNPELHSNYLKFIFPIVKEYIDKHPKCKLPSPKTGYIGEETVLKMLSNNGIKAKRDNQSNHDILLPKLKLVIEVKATIWNGNFTNFSRLKRIPNSSGYFCFTFLNLEDNSKTQYVLMKQLDYFEEKENFNITEYENKEGIEMHTIGISTKRLKELSKKYPFESALAELKKLQDKCKTIKT